MQNKVKWRREDDTNQSVPYMFEEVKPNHWCWVRYTSSKVHDKNEKGSSFSKGYLSFLKALKCGYTVEYPDQV